MLRVRELRVSEVRIREMYDACEFVSCEIFLLIRCLQVGVFQGLLILKSVSLGGSLILLPSSVVLLVDLLVFLISWVEFHWAHA